MTSARAESKNIHRTKKEITKVSSPPSLRQKLFRETRITKKKKKTMHSLERHMTPFIIYKKKKKNTSTFRNASHYQRTRY